MVNLPLWAVFLVSIGTPVLSFFGVLFAQWILRQRARELETRSRREETMRTLRWAAELAVADDDARAKLGIAQLAALGASEILDASERLFVDAALESIYDGVAAQVLAGRTDVQLVARTARVASAEDVTAGGDDDGE